MFPYIDIKTQYVSIYLHIFPKLSKICQGKNNNCLLNRHYLMKWLSWNHTAVHLSNSINSKCYLLPNPFVIIVLYEEIFTWRLTRDKVIDEQEIERESERHGLQIILHLAFKFGNCIAKFHWTRLSNICTSDKPYYSAFNAKERNWIILFVICTSL